MHKIDYEYILISKIATKIFSGEIEPNTKYKTLVAEAKDRYHQNIYTDFKLVTTKRNSGCVKRLNRYYGIVYDAVYTIYNNTPQGKAAVFRLGELKNVIHGKEAGVNNDKINCTKAEKKELTKILDDLCKISLMLNATDEYNHKYTTTQNYKIIKNEPLLSLAKQIKTDDNSGDDNYNITYTITKKPRLGAYCQEVGQIITCPLILFGKSSNFPISLPNGKESCLQYSKEVIYIKRYLIRRLESLRNTKSRSNNPKIAIKSSVNRGESKTGLIPEGDFKELTHTKIESIVCETKAVLDYYKHIKYINDYIIEKNIIILSRDEESKKYVNDPNMCCRIEENTQHIETDDEENKS